MWRYRCLHCCSDLGPQIPDQVEPVCDAHPEGVVQLVFVELL